MDIAEIMKIKRLLILILLIKAVISFSYYFSKYKMYVHDYNRFLL